MASIDYEFVPGRKFETVKCRFCPRHNRKTDKRCGNCDRPLK